MGDPVVDCGNASYATYKGGCRCLACRECNAELSRKWRRKHKPPAAMMLMEGNDICAYDTITAVTMKEYYAGRRLNP